MRSLIFCLLVSAYSTSLWAQAPPAPVLPPGFPAFKTPGGDAAEALLKPIPVDPEAYAKLREQTQILIKQLSVDSFAQREAATKELTLIGCRNVDVLQEVAEKSDIEAKIRIKQILELIKQQNVVVRDALGHPIPNAKLELFSKTKEKLQSHTTNDCGGCLIPGFNRLELGFKHGAYAMIHHPDYGTTKVALRYEFPRPGLQHLKNEFCVSLVHRDSFAYKRAIKGVVVQEDGTPVAEAEVTCSEARRTDHSGTMRPHAPQTVITDQHGRFALYLNQSSLVIRPSNTKLIPPDMNFSLRVDKEGMFPWVGTHTNAESISVKMPVANRQFKIRLLGSDNEPLDLDLDANPRALRVGYRGTEQRQHGSRISPEKFLSGKLAAGRYFVSWHGKPFDELTISDESPDEITLALPAAREAHTYRGTVLHAVTGEPFEGAFAVTLTARCERELVTLKNDEWSLLERQKPNEFEDEALELLRSMYGDELTVVRSAADGTFEVTESARGESSTIVVLARGMIALNQNCTVIHQLREKGEDWPNFRLMPCAFVTVGIPKAQTNAANSGWKIVDSDYPQLLKQLRENRFVDMKPDTESGPTIWHSKPVRLMVPANVKMQLSLTPRGNHLSPLTIPQVFNLAPGETLDLGSDHVFAQKISIRVRVVDEFDKPLEGMPVRPRMRLEQAGGKTHSHYGKAVLTDIRGESTILVNGGKESAAAKVSGIHWSNPLRESKNLQTEFLPNKERTEPIIIQLTAEQIEAIRNPQPSR